MSKSILIETICAEIEKEKRMKVHVLKMRNQRNDYLNKQRINLLKEVYQKRQLEKASMQ